MATEALEAKAGWLVLTLERKAELKALNKNPEVLYVCGNSADTSRNSADAPEEPKVPGATHGRARRVHVGNDERENPVSEAIVEHLEELFKGPSRPPARQSTTRNEAEFGRSQPRVLEGIAQFPAEFGEASTLDTNDTNPLAAQAERRQWRSKAPEGKLKWVDLKAYLEGEAIQLTHSRVHNAGADVAKQVQSCEDCRSSTNKTHLKDVRLAGAVPVQVTTTEPSRANSARQQVEADLQTTVEENSAMVVAKENSAELWDWSCGSAVATCGTREAWPHKKYLSHKSGGASVAPYGTSKAWWRKQNLSHRELRVGYDAVPRQPPEKCPEHRRRPAERPRSRRNVGKTNTESTKTRDTSILTAQLLEAGGTINSAVAWTEQVGVPRKAHDEGPMLRSQMRGFPVVADVLGPRTNSAVTKSTAELKLGWNKAEGSAGYQLHLNDGPRIQAIHVMDEAEVKLRSKYEPDGEIQLGYQVGEGAELCQPPSYADSPSRNSAVRRDCAEALVLTDWKGKVLSYDASVTVDGAYGSCSWILWSLPDWSIVIAASAYLPSVTLGVAKSVAVSNGLVAARKLGVTNLIIAGSSHIDNPDSANGYKAKQLPAEFAFGSTGITNLNFVRYIHVARQYNSAAQAMVMEALDNMAGRVVLSGKRKAELKLLNRIPEVLQSVGKLGNSANESGMMPAGPEMIAHVSKSVNQKCNRPGKSADAQNRVRNTGFGHSRVYKPGQDSTKVGTSADEPKMMDDLPARPEPIAGVPASGNQASNRPATSEGAQNRVCNMRFSYSRVHKPVQASTKVGNSAEAVPLMVSSRADAPEKNETSSGIFAVVGELWGILLPQSRVHRPEAWSSRAHQMCVDDGSTEQVTNCLSMVIKAAPMVTDFAHATKEDKPNDNPKGARTAELSWNIPDKWLLHLAELRTPATTCVDPLVARVSRRPHAQDAQEEKSSWSTLETYTQNEPDQETQRQVHDIEKTDTTRLGHSAKNTWAKLDESHRLRIDADESTSHSAVYDLVQKKIMEFKGIQSQDKILNSAMDEIKLGEDTQRSDKLADTSAIYVDGQTAQRDDVTST
ncbi:unnamed protein product [Phytophthora fragariaefolia]|uniref:Unnamed protein product n=1 Tax=Phytophthora fragariaefolia TaxID=1490495 RepID=A0A9W7DCR1_9STRA|nr:unnamed protein product [Phytophthora fragariaefolia]